MDDVISNSERYLTANMGKYGLRNLCKVHFLENGSYYESTTKLTVYGRSVGQVQCSLSESSIRSSVPAETGSCDFFLDEFEVKSSTPCFFSKVNEWELLVKSCKQILRTKTYQFPASCMDCIKL
jgi:hypothetical protein